MYSQLIMIVIALKEKIKVKFCAIDDLMRKNEIVRTHLGTIDKLC